VLSQTDDLIRKSETQLTILAEKQNQNLVEELLGRLNVDRQLVSYLVAEEKLKAAKTSEPRVKQLQRSESVKHLTYKDRRALIKAAPKLQLP